MATEFTQDAVLFFLQSNGGKVRNAELLAHFTAFLRGEDNQKSHRELFKQFVNSVATVRQEDGVRYVALRRKFRGATTTTTGGGVPPGYLPHGYRLPSGVSSGHPEPSKKHHPGGRQSDRTQSAGRRDRSPRDVNRNPAERRPSSREKQPPPAPRETTGGVLRLLTETNGETILPSAGIVVNNNNNAGETDLNLGISPLRGDVPKVRLVEPSYPYDSTEDAPPQLQVPLVSSSTEQLVPCYSTKPTSPPGNNNSHGFDRTEHVTLGLLDQSARVQSAELGQPRGQIDTRRDQASCTPPPHLLPPTKAQEKHEETPQQNTEKRREACLKFIEAERQQTAGVPLLHHHSDQLPIIRLARLRKSYKTAVSYDDDDDDEQEEEELEIPRRRPCSEAVERGAWPLNVPLEQMNRAISSSSPCISTSPAPSSSLDSSSSLTSGFVSLTASGLSSERNGSTLGSQLQDIPAIHIEGSEREWAPSQTPGWSSGSGQVAGSGTRLASAPVDSNPPRRSLPLEAENYMLSSLDRAHCIGTPGHRHLSTHLNHPGSQCDPANSTQFGPNPEQQLKPGARPGLGLDPDPGISGPSGLEPEERPSSSHSSPIFVSPAEYPSSDWPQSGSARASDWSNSDDSLNDTLIEEGEIAAGTKVQQVLQRAEETRLLSLMHRSERKITAPWHHSTGHLLDNEDAPASVASWQHSTGHLRDSQEEAESSEGSTSSLTVRKRPAVTRRISSRLRSRMCRSLGAGLDDTLSGAEEEERRERRGRKGGKSSRQDRLSLLSSSLSMNYHFSNSSLSSCSTPPRCHSYMDLAEAEEEEGKCDGSGTVVGGTQGLPATAITSSSARSTAHDTSDFDRESSVPLDRKEHDWLVKGATGSWTDIYSLFREEPSLLNRRDFISGNTVLHWIAKHGDHRVLNTLWYGVSKAGLTLDVDARSACGYTPLHLAAIHGHKKMMRLLVQKFNANVGLRDTSGKRPWQYLEQPRPIDMLQLLKAPEGVCEGRGGRRGGGGRRSEGGGSGGEVHHPSRLWDKDHRNGVPSVSSPASRVKRSSSIAAFLKHKSLLLFPGQQSDTFV